tara:strand:+ start:2609 stop:4357 length:1749 start_codon:yes stop_codon:yes gene_type:complete
MALLENVFYINLDHRVDRKNNVEKQLDYFKWKYQRFPAITNENGRIGCTLSHLQLLKYAKQQNLPYIVIVEDDIIFTKPDLFNNNLKLFLDNNNNYDVLLLAGNVIPPYQKINEYSIKVEFCQTTTGYMVKNHYYDKLIHNINTGMTHLLKWPDQHRVFAIDKWWTKLQEKDNWFFIIPPTVTQADDYSDIEKKQVQYSSSMLDIEKKWFNTTGYKVPSIFSVDEKQGTYYDARGSLDIYMDKKDKTLVLKNLLNTPEKIMNFINKDRERKSELINTYKNLLENNTTISHFNKDYNDTGKEDLTETTFIIPFFYDFEERLQNLNTLINFISKHFNTNIFIAEMGPKSYKDRLSIKHRASITYFYTESNEPFSRTTVTNNALKYVETTCVVINDVDCFTLPDSYIKAQKMILFDNFKAIHPFSSPPGCFNMLPITVNHFTNNNYDINTIPLSGCNHNQVAGVGGILFIDYDTYKLLGFENKYFISYSPEDQERIKRFRRLNLKTTNQINENLHNSNDDYFKSPLFHMEHPRTPDSTIMHKYFQSNELLMHCLDKLDNDNFIKYLHEESNSTLSLNEYKNMLSK